MRSLGDILGGHARPQPSGMRCRRGAGFVLDPLALSTRLDRNQRAKLLWVAEGLERRTKAKGRKSGVLGYVGLQVLRALLLRFQNAKTGLCCPGYSALQRETGLCRASIAAAIKRLEACGLLRVTRRLIRRPMLRTSPITGEPEVIAAVVQTSNLYAFSMAAKPSSPCGCKTCIAPYGKVSGGFSGQVKRTGWYRPTPAGIDNNSNNIVKLASLEVFSNKDRGYDQTA